MKIEPLFWLRANILGVKRALYGIWDSYVVGIKN
jgi:hypothetical protein